MTLAGPFFCGSHNAQGNDRFYNLQNDEVNDHIFTIQTRAQKGMVTAAAVNEVSLNGFSQTLLSMRWEPGSCRWD